MSLGQHTRQVQPTRAILLRCLSHLAQEEAPCNWKEPFALGHAWRDWSWAPSLFAYEYGATIRPAQLSTCIEPNQLPLAIIRQGCSSRAVPRLLDLVSAAATMLGAEKRLASSLETTTARLTAPDSLYTGCRLVGSPSRRTEPPPHGSRCRCHQYCNLRNLFETPSLIN